ncbi:MAG: hypothetical protein ACHQ53_10030 [Polyangiales bacterium]
MGGGRAIAALLLCLIVLSTTRVARAQRVALVRPAQDDPVLSDAFNRLNAELRIHEFEPFVLDPATPARDPNELALAAKRADALACIAFVRREGKTSVEVWLADRVSGKVTMRTLALAQAVDAPSLLAIRAVDLLRASFREFASAERPPPEVVGVDARPVPAAVRALAASPEPAWTLRVEGTLMLDRPALGPAFGPGLGVLRRLSERVELGVTLAAPLLFAGWKTTEGSASVGQELAWLELRVRAFRSRLLELGANAAAGEHYLSATGQANAPLHSRSSSVLSWAFALGAHAQLRLVGDTAFVLSLRGLFLTPRPGVGIGQRTSVIALPTLYATTGFMVGF